MNDNALIAQIVSVLNAGFAANGQGSIQVLQAYQPTQEGIPSGPSVFLHKVSDQRMGSPNRVNGWDDTVLASFTGSVLGSTLSVSSIVSGAIAVSQVLAGVDVPDNIQITGLGTSGTYSLSQGFTLATQAMDTIAGMVYTETQQYLTTFQISALSTQDPSDVSQLTASDIANLAVAILQSLFAIQTFEDAGFGVLKIGDIRNMAFTDDRERYEYNPSFDVTFTTKQSIISTQPIVTEVSLVIDRV